MKRPIRPALVSFGLVRSIGLGLVSLSLTACAGYEFRPNGAGVPDWGGSTFQQQARATNCESRPVYDTWGNYLRTDTVCR